MASERVTAGAAPTGRPSLRPFAPALWFSGANALTWMVALGTPMVLFVERLGGSTFQVGLASSFTFLLMPIQVISTAALGRLGYRRQMMTGWGVRGVFLLVPLGLALAAPDPPASWMPGLLVAAMFCFCVVRAFGVAAHIPWLAAILPGEVRGRFFATDHFVVGIVGVATLLLCSVLFASLPGYEAFALVYALAMTGSLFAVLNLLRLPTAPNPTTAPVRDLPRQAVRLCLQPGLFRSYLLLMLLATVVTSSIPAFTAYYLKVEAGLASSRILVLTASQFAGMIVGAWTIRHLLDRVPIHRFFQAGALLIGAFDLFWLATVGGSELYRLLPIAFFVLGVATSVQNSSHFTYLPELAGEDERPVMIAVFTAVLGVLAGLAPMLWGLALREAGPEPGIDVVRFEAFFALGAAISALLVWLFSRLRDPRSHAGLQRLAP